MSNREELSRLSLEELKELGMLVHKAARILNNDSKKLSELNLEGREIALQMELISVTVTAQEWSDSGQGLGN